MASEKRQTAKKTTTTKPRAATTRTRKRRLIPTHDQIAERAYFIHLDEGGDTFGNWVRAERELTAV